jgi:hypothetical protein
VKRTIVFVLLLALLVATSGIPALAEDQAGTTLSAEKTAEGFFEAHQDYDWAVTKSVDPDFHELARNQSGTSNYTVTATKTMVGETLYYGVRGSIYVYNGGERATEGLAIVDVVQVKSGSGQFVDYASYNVDVSAKPVLGPLEGYWYPYEFTFAPVADALYRNTARVTITNHSGYLGEPFGPAFGGEGVKADFSIPSTPDIVEYDGSATISDVLTVPTGFGAVPSDSGPWNLTNTGTINYSVAFTNLSAMCDSWYEAPNTVTLVESDSGATRTASALVELYTPPCPDGDARTIGYWKTHAGFHGKNADRVSEHLPLWLGTAGGAKSVQVLSAAQAVEILSSMGANGIDKLKAQLLAAKLNVSAGVPDTSISGTIAAADSFLASNGSEDWASLSKANQKVVLGWMTALDIFNNSGQ